MQIRSTMAMAAVNKTGPRELRAWTDCTGERDHLIFYDGASTDDPVLAKYCGGAWLPSVVSRGPSMLVAFHSSPFSVPLRSDGATSPLRGFELDVDVLYSDSSSLDYSRQARNSQSVATFKKRVCEWIHNKGIEEAEAIVAATYGGPGPCPLVLDNQLISAYQ